ncbi:DUF5819 family protein [Streptomyces sp. YIM 98790]|uniref:DUF5819 family protein n=1 Tax=Streptomyces sp. YIM 98790 TaxID=2689077 RepID=UPI00140AFC39|nr:DUF5819 family protein [Streptomyces sp. YIM 98790]
MEITERQEAEEVREERDSRDSRDSEETGAPGVGRAPHTLSRPLRAAVQLFAAGLALLTLWHMLAGFLSIAPDNVLKRRTESAVDGYLEPELVRNWLLFAPSPPRADLRIEVRAEIRRDSAGVIRTDWLDLTQQDLDNIRHQLLPSHADRAQLFRAWSQFRKHTDDSFVPYTEYGLLMDAHVHRIALLRLAEQGRDLDRVERIQLRSGSVAIPPPPWERGRGAASGEPAYREAGWREVTDADRGVAALAGGGTTP